MVSKSFHDWKRLVNAGVGSLVGMDCDDLPDVDYYGMYEEGKTAKEAARQAVREAGYALGYGLPGGEG